MNKINPNFGYWQSNLSKKVIINLYKTDNQGTFSIISAPLDYTVEPYTVGTPGTETYSINGFKIVPLIENKPFFVLPSNNISSLLTSAATHLMDSQTITPVTYPETGVLVPENCSIIYMSMFDNPSNSYPVTLTFYILD